MSDYTIRLVEVAGQMLRQTDQETFNQLSGNPIAQAMEGIAHVLDTRYVTWFENLAEPSENSVLWQMFLQKFVQKYLMCEIGTETVAEFINNVKYSISENAEYWHFIYTQLSDKLPFDAERVITTDMTHKTDRKDDTRRTGTERTQSGGTETVKETGTRKTQNTGTETYGKAGSEKHDISNSSNAQKLESDTPQINYKSGDYASGLERTKESGSASDTLTFNARTDTRTPNLTSTETPDITTTRTPNTTTTRTPDLDDKTVVDGTLKDTGTVKYTGFQGTSVSQEIILAKQAFTPLIREVVENCEKCFMSIW